MKVHTCWKFLKHGLNFHSSQLPPQSLVSCSHDIKLWRTSNQLKLNNNKTELMVVASKVLLQKVGDIPLDMDSCSLSPSTEVCNLGVILDSTLSFQPHIKSITKSAFYHLKNISRQPALPLQTCG